MQRRNFLKATAILAATPTVNKISTASVSSQIKKEIYEWRIYTLKEEPTYLLDDFFEHILIPFYNYNDISVGAFENYNKDSLKQRFYLFVYPDINTFYTLKNKIWEENVLPKEAKSFYDQTASNPVYSEYESYLCEAFDKIPQMKLPDTERTLFELRHYHSPNDEANYRKVRMFNIDEIDIFDQVGINSVCYGNVLAGPHMPALMYLTWYKDETTRNAAWNKFGKHPDWIRIKDLPEYAYTATNNTNRLLSPLPYSQI